MGEFGVYIWWFLFAIGFLLAEATISGFVALFFGIGAIFAGGIAIAGFDLTTQILTMAVVSLLGIIFGRKFLVSRVKVNKDVIKTNVDALIGREGVVIHKIPPFGKGRMLCNGENWSAQSVDGIEIEEGQKVIIREIRGVTAIVEKISNPLEG